MARDLPIGNGTLLVNFDFLYQLRDIYFPHVGMENHTAGHPCRFGVWVNGTFRWIADPGWQRQLGYESDTLVTRVLLRHPDLPLAIVCTDAVDFHENLYLRRVAVTSEADSALEVRFFFHHDFHIYENEVGDTAYYEPRRRVVFHYKDLRWFLINGFRGPDDHGVDQFATGQKEIGGLEGTWRDAEDGTLSGNAIAQGSVDSTVALHLTLAPRGYGEVYYWIAAGQTFDEVTAINRRVVERGPAVYLERIRHYWQLWARKDGNEMGELPVEIARLFTSSLLILRTQIDVDGGILAANDFDVTQFNRDTYSYVWPRDGAIISTALTRAGYSTPSSRFLAFCARLLTKEGYFLHKYNPDGSLASSWHPWFADNQPQIPIQEDETGLVLWALWQFFEHFPEVEFIKPLYRDLIIRAGEFLASYRDPESGLPLPSWDLWEERRGVHAWTVAATYAGLVAAARFANAFGEEDIRDRLLTAAREVKAGADAWLWHEELGRFVRTVHPRPSGGYDVDQTFDASVAGLFLFGMYAATDPRIVRTMESLRERLWVKTPIGGVARYENDYYHQVSHDLANVPGNPWIICTLWLARWEIARAGRPEELESATEYLHWAARRALPSGVLAEQVDPYSGAPLSVSPLTWSHGEVVLTIVDYLDKLTRLNLCPACGHPLFLRERRRIRALRLMDVAGDELPASEEV
ncbi:MAG: glycoside hydrolase family 15 protein [Chloroflexi bacterium]|nr:glycoside hydrolase family 15 protein [Chloroflexota bacterium]